MNITVLIKDNDTARLNDGIRLALGLTINHRVSLLITGKGAGAFAAALKDDAFKKQFLETVELIKSMSGNIKTEKAIAGIDTINSISKDDLTNMLLESDSIITF
jgi:hypothetical protein